MKLFTLFLFSLIFLAGCAGDFSQARVDDLDANKRNHVQDVERAMDDKLTAVELRSSLKSIDDAILAENAHKGKEVDLEALRAKLEAESDKAVAALFDGDTGRDDPPGE